MGPSNNARKYITKYIIVIVLGVLSCDYCSFVLRFSFVSLILLSSVSFHIIVNEFIAHLENGKWAKRFYQKLLHGTRLEPRASI